MLENELWGNTIENWGISILIILGAIIIVKLLIRQGITIANFTVDFLNDCNRETDENKQG